MHTASTPSGSGAWKTRSSGKVSTISDPLSPVYEIRASGSTHPPNEGSGQSCTKHSRHKHMGTSMKTLKSIRREEATYSARLRETKRILDKLVIASSLYHQLRRRHASLRVDPPRLAYRASRQHGRRRRPGHRKNPDRLHTYPLSQVPDRVPAANEQDPHLAQGITIPD